MAITQRNKWTNGKVEKAERKEDTQKVQGRQPQPPSESQTKDPFLIVDWFWLHWDLKAQALGKATAFLKNNALLNFLWPMSSTYHSPLNPVFLTACFNPETFNTYPVWMARDGLVPLLWFYKFYPSPPENFKSRILIHEEFAPFVPTEWRKRTGTYRICSVAQEPPRDIKRVLISGIANEVCCSANTAKDIMTAMTTLCGGKEALTAMQKQCFILERHSGFSEHNQSFSPNMLFEIGRHLSLENLQAIEWRQMDSTTDFQGTGFAEFNDRLLFADSYVTHHVMGRGGYLLPVDSYATPSTGGKFVQLSPYHGVRIHEKLEGQYMLPTEPRDPLDDNPFRERFETVMRSDANLKIPWPTWIKSWLQEAQQFKSEISMTQ